MPEFRLHIMPEIGLHIGWGWVLRRCRGRARFFFVVKAGARRWAKVGGGRVPKRRKKIARAARLPLRSGRRLSSRGSFPLRPPHPALVAGVQLADWQVPEVDFDDFIGVPGGAGFSPQAKSLPGKGTPHHTFPSTPPHPAAGPHEQGEPAGGIMQRWGFAVAPRVAPIAALRHAPFQRVMRALFVVVATETRKTLRLAAQGGGGRTGGGRFQDAVHLLVRAIILRFRRPAEIGFDPQPPPPDAEPAQAQRAVPAKGRAIIHADLRWQPSKLQGTSSRYASTMLLRRFEFYLAGEPAGAGMEILELQLWSFF